MGKTSTKLLSGSWAPKVLKSDWDFTVKMHRTQRWPLFAPCLSKGITMHSCRPARGDVMMSAALNPI